MGIAIILFAFAVNLYSFYNFSQTPGITIERAFRETLRDIPQSGYMLIMGLLLISIGFAQSTKSNASTKVIRQLLILVAFVIVAAASYVLYGMTLGKR